MEAGITSAEPEKMPASERLTLDQGKDSSSCATNPVLHVIVIGFHHKKGCQVEYSWPPIIPENDSRSHELPAQWKHLPSLALPDGSHNFDADTCFFHLPDLENPRKTIFGISCYRQMDASQVVNKTADITRATVQKSVCVLSRLPLYGQIQVKMQLITQAYFREGDFDRLDLIHQTYDNLNSCLTDDMCGTQQLYVGLSARAFVQRLRQRSLVLFKLLLLERKVLLFQSPVVDLTSFLLTLLSLHPGMLERGLDESACVVPSDTPPLSLSPDCNTETDPPSPDAIDALSVENLDDEDEQQDDCMVNDPPNSISPNLLSPTAVAAVGDIIGKIDGVLLGGYLTGGTSATDAQQHEPLDDDRLSRKDDSEKTVDKTSPSANNGQKHTAATSDGNPEEAREAVEVDGCAKNGGEQYSQNGDNEHHQENKLTSASKLNSIEEPAITKDTKEITEARNSPNNENAHCDKTAAADAAAKEKERNFNKVCDEPIENYGLPLKIFTGGNLCHPYVSLSYLDNLTQPSVHGYMIGATNDLFIQKKGLADVIIEIEKDRFDIHDADLKKALQLTTEDLRFTDNLVQHVCGGTSSGGKNIPAETETDVFLDGIGWEGGDEWVRAQFRYYLVSLLRTVINRQEPSQANHFNSSFIHLWKKTRNYRAWRHFRRQQVSQSLTKDLPSHDSLQQLSPGHPYSRQPYSMHDVGLIYRNTMQNTESGKKLGKAVASTGMAVSKGLSSVKSTFSSFPSLFGSSGKSRSHVTNESMPNEAAEIQEQQPSKQSATTITTQKDTLSKKGECVPIKSS